LAIRRSILLFGGGRMGSALVRGWLAGGIAPASINVVDPAPSPALVALAASGGIGLNAPVGPAPEQVVVLAVKPQKAGELADALQGLAAPGTMIVSIMAGKTLGDLERLCPAASAFVRAHPNLPAAIGCGITAASASAGCSVDQRAFIARLFECVGSFEWLDGEALLDVVTGLSGSGPAYVFYLADCLTLAGIEAGLPAAIAERLARATISGAGAMLRSDGRSAGELRRDVTSPAGTTEAGLRVLMADAALQGLIGRTVAAAIARARALAG
jgi:pyrroline-5-carboxylate reductase